MLFEIQYTVHCGRAVPADAAAEAAPAAFPAEPQFQLSFTGLLVAQAEDIFGCPPYSFLREIKDKMVYVQ